MSRFRKLGLVAVGLAVWLAGLASVATAQDAEATIRQIVDVANQMANTLSTIRDADSAQAAQSRLAGLAQRMQSLDARMRGLRLTPDEDQRLKEEYGAQAISAIERLVREAERIDRDPNIPLQMDVAAMRRQLEQMRAMNASAGAGAGASTRRGDGSSGFIFGLLLFVIFAVCFGFLFTEGMWSNAVRLINVITAALLATNCFEWAAGVLEGWGASFTYFWDFLALWGLFALFNAILRGATDHISKVKVRFRKITDQIGSPVFAAFVGWTMVCFTAMSLHTAPLARNFMRGSFQPEEKMLLRLSPDRKWLGFVQRMSLGTFSRTATAEDIREEPEWEEDKTRTFDPRGEFMPKYATRRANLEAHVNKTGKIRIRTEETSE
ncbi:MAG: hypothetical protein ACYSWU_06585 [Planctomycetota bacterium]